MFSQSITQQHQIQAHCLHADDLMTCAAFCYLTSMLRFSEEKLKDKS